MSVQEYEIEVNGQRAVVYKENSIAPGDPYKYFLSGRSGQGCGTIWFNSLVSSKRALIKDGVKSGHDLDNCQQCSCNNPGQEFKPYVCSQVKREYALKFEPQERVFCDS